MDTGIIVLGFLMSGPKTGYKIKEITGKMMRNYNLSLNQIYPLLRKLESEKLIRKEVIIQIGKPNKHLYSLTCEGKIAFYERITATPRPVDYTIDFLTRMFFFRFLSREKVLIEFEKEIRSLEKQLEELAHRRPAVDKERDEDGTFIYETIVMMIEMLKQRYTRELADRREKIGTCGDDPGKQATPACSP